jgi:hypothetical protein
MITEFFMHRIKHDSTKEGPAAWDKGIEVHAAEGNAKQSYHAYLGAYGYGHNADIDFVSCEITDSMGRIRMAETWSAEDQ